MDRWLKSWLLLAKYQRQLNLPSSGPMIRKQRCDLGNKTMIFPIYENSKYLCHPFYSTFFIGSQTTKCLLLSFPKSDLRCLLGSLVCSVYNWNWSWNLDCIELFHASSLLFACMLLNRWYLLMWVWLLRSCQYERFEK